MSTTQNVVVSEEIQALMKLISPPLHQVARELGVAYDTVRGWAAGKSDPSPENRARLVGYIREHARHLEEAAEELEG